MKTLKLERGIKYDTTEKHYKKTEMYEFDFSVVILVQEKQKDGTVDHTILCFKLHEDEKGYFSEEYRPVGMPSEGTKKPDITAIIEKSSEKRVKWFIYDMKDTVIRSDVALKLCSQWKSGIEHISKEYLNDLNGYHIDNSLGVITRYYDKEMLRKQIDECKQKIANQNQLMTARKSKTKEIEYKRRIQATENLINETFEYFDEIAETKMIYPIKILSLLSDDNILYTSYLDIHL